uniref:Uncharacterized protein n=1 Tax=Panagrellus redivivus TaxID=6233 RepID=A0A7E4UM28_PANRE
MEGLLHIFLRHHPEFEKEVPGLIAQRLSLPAKMQMAISKIAAADNMNAAMLDVNSFKRMFHQSGNARRILYQIQIMVFKYLENLVSTTPSTMTSNTAGKNQLNFVSKTSKKVVLGVSNIHKPVNSFNIPRRVRYVRTAFMKN